MCVRKLLSLFSKKKQSASKQDSEPASEIEHTGLAGPAEQLSPKPLSLPYPEETPDPSRTIDNVNLDSALNAWEVNYNVPESYWEYWKTKIAIKLDVDIAYPAGTYEQDGLRHLVIRPEWLNPGVVAHEQAHNSYALLTEAQKLDFSSTYTALKTSDPLIVLLYSINRYGLSNDIEGHAEVYRYLGCQMPQSLKKYYPKLF